MTIFKGEDHNWGDYQWIQAPASRLIGFFPYKFQAISWSSNFLVLIPYLSFYFHLNWGFYNFAGFIIFLVLLLCFYHVFIFPFLPNWLHLLGFFSHVPIQHQNYFPLIIKLCNSQGTYLIVLKKIFLVGCYPPTLETRHIDLHPMILGYQ